MKTLILLLMLAPQDAPDLKKFDRVMKSDKSTVEQKIEAVRAVSKVPNKETLKALAPYLTTSNLSIRILTARDLGRFKEVKGVEDHLIRALSDEANRDKQFRGVRITIIRSLGRIGSKKAITAINARISHKDVWIAKAAADAAGKLRQRSSIPLLIKALLALEGRSGRRVVTESEPTRDIRDRYVPQYDPSEGLTERYVPGSGYGSPNPSGGGSKPDTSTPSQKLKTRREILRKPILDALRAITRKKYDKAKEWEGWWRTSRSRFKVPK